MKFEKGSAHSFILLGFIVLIITVLGVVFWRNFIDGAVTNTDTDISTWAMYKNETLPVSFKYPSEWSIQGEVGRDKKAGYVRLYGGSKDSEKGMALAVFYAKDMAKTLPRQTSCPVNLDDMKSCERYVTDTMSGLLVSPKTGANYYYSTSLGADNYSFSVHNGFINKSTFKELLKSVKPR